jgi:hypothetical protein
MREARRGEAAVSSADDRAYAHVCAAESAAEAAVAVVASVAAVAVTEAVAAAAAVAAAIMGLVVVHTGAVCATHR